MPGSVKYAFMKIDEGFYEDVIIAHLRDEHHYDHLYGPDVPRTSEKIQ